MQMRTERTQSLLYVLTIATIDTQIIENPKPTLWIRRNKQATLHHILHQQSRFQHHRFSTGIGTAHHHDALFIQYQ